MVVSKVEVNMRSKYKTSSLISQFHSPCPQGSQYVAVNVRVLSWPSANGTNETLNGKDPGTSLSATKQLDSGDRLTLQLPISSRTKTLFILHFIDLSLNEVVTCNILNIRQTHYL